MMSSDLKQRTISGTIWKLTEKFSIQGFLFLESIVMARLLNPTDYGLIGMVVILNGVCAILVDSGFSNALIRKKERRSEDYSTVFDFNVVMNFVMAGFMVLVAPFLAKFYNQPILRNIIFLFAIQSASGSLLAVQGAKMIIDLQFKTMSLINVISTVSTGIISIILAFSGLGVYALVIPNIINIFIRFGLYYYYQHWFPGTKFSKNSFKDLFGYGSKMLVSNLLNCIFNNIYPIVIGKVYSPSALGYYTRGQGYASLPSATVNDAIVNVSLPILSKIQDDTEQLASIYRKMLRVTAYTMFPVMMGLAALAQPLVVLMISSKWEPCVIFLQILCFSFMWSPITSLNLNLLQVKGRSDLFLRITIIQKILLLAVVFITVPFGVIYMCWGSVVSTYLTLFINTYYTGKLIGVGFLRQLKDLSPSLIASLIMGGLVFFVCNTIDSFILKLLIGIPLGFTMYYGISKIYNFMELPYVVDIIKTNILPKIRNKI